MRIRCHISCQNRAIFCIVFSQCIINSITQDILDNWTPFLRKLHLFKGKDCIFISTYISRKRTLNIIQSFMHIHKTSKYGLYNREIALKRLILWKYVYSLGKYITLLKPRYICWYHKKHMHWRIHLGLRWKTKTNHIFLSLIVTISKRFPMIWSSLKRKIIFLAKAGCTKACQITCFIFAEC